MISEFSSEIYKRTAILSEKVPYDFVQVNLSNSKRGVIRGLHYQMRPMEQGKLVTFKKGKIYQVAVDIRKGSPSYGKVLPMVFRHLRTHWLFTLKQKNILHHTKGV